MRLVTRLLLFSAALTGLVNLGRVVLGRRSERPLVPRESGGGGIRTGSFDRWPAVPPAPGRHPSGD
jgi:hypothetical protein